MRHIANRYPIEEPLSPKDVEVLQDAGVAASLLRKFPVDGPFTLATSEELDKYDIDSVLKLTSTCHRTGERGRSASLLSC